MPWTAGGAPVAMDMLFGHVKLGMSPSATAPNPCFRKRATCGTTPSRTPCSKYAGSPPSMQTRTTGCFGQRYVTPLSETPGRSIRERIAQSGVEVDSVSPHHSRHLRGALEVLSPRLAADGAIVSLQNGLNEELIAAAVGARRTVGCLVNWAADWTAPGRILHGGTGAFVLGELDGRVSDRVERLGKLLDAVAPTRVSTNILGYTWAKHVYGALLIATAVVDAHVYEVVERSPRVQRMLVALVVENMGVAEAAGVRLEAFDEYDPVLYRAAGRGDPAARERAMAIVATHYRAHTKTKTGIWRDLAV